MTRHAAPSPATVALAEALYEGERPPDWPQALAAARHLLDTARTEARAAAFTEAADEMDRRCAPGWALRRMADGARTQQQAAARPADARMVCLVCDTPVHWIDCPTGGWWAHADHPHDGHDAQPRPAAGLGGDA